MDIDKVFAVRSRDPLDHEGSPGVVAVLTEEEAARETVRMLSDMEQEEKEKRWGERWRNVALDFDYDVIPLTHTAEEAVQQYLERGGSL